MKIAIYRQHTVQLGFCAVIEIYTAWIIFPDIKCRVTFLSNNMQNILRWKVTPYWPTANYFITKVRALRMAAHVAMINKLPASIYWSVILEGHIALVCGTTGQKNSNTTHSIGSRLGLDHFALDYDIEGGLLFYTDIGIAKRSTHNGVSGLLQLLPGTRFNIAQYSIEHCSDWAKTQVRY